MIQHAERPIRAIVTLIRASLETILATADSEWGDFTLPRFVSGTVYDYELRERESKDAPVQIEVFDEAAFSPFNPYTDIAAGRSVQEIELTIRVTVFNDSQLTESQMTNSRRRYGAALDTLFKENPYVDTGDDAIQTGTISNITPSVAAGEQGIDSVTATATVTVRLEECIT